MRLFIGNISWDATQENVEEILKSYGATSVVLITDRESGRSKGFAFAEIPDETKAKAAVTDLHGAEWIGRRLEVSQARPSEKRSGGGNGHGGKQQRNGRKQSEAKN